MLLNQVQNHVGANMTGVNQISLGYRRFTIKGETWVITHGIICDRVVAEGSIEDDYKEVAKILKNGAFTY